MKKNLMLIALMTVSSLIFAQPHHDRHEKNNKKESGRYLAMLKKELLLTDEQYTKVKSINESFAKQLSAIRKDTAMSQGRAQTLTKKLRDDQQAQMKSVLNEPQWTKLNEMKHKGPRGKNDKRPPYRESRPGRSHHGDARFDDEERG